MINKMIIGALDVVTTKKLDLRENRKQKERQRITAMPLTVDQSCDFSDNESESGSDFDEMPLGKKETDTPPKNKQTNQPVIK